MKKVMVFGSFDVLHKGHHFLLKNASKRGQLTIVVALDSTILKLKKQKTHFRESTRVKHLQQKYPKTTVVLGREKNKMYWVEKIQPDIFILGYDQSAFVDKLKKYAESNDCEIAVLPSYKAHKYKSSKLKKSFWRMLQYKLFYR